MFLTRISKAYPEVNGEDIYIFTMIIPNIFRSHLHWRRTSSLSIQTLHQSLWYVKIVRQSDWYKCRAAVFTQHRNGTRIIMKIPLDPNLKTPLIMSVRLDCVLFKFPCEGLIWEAKLINGVSLSSHRSVCGTVRCALILTKDWYFNYWVLRENISQLKYCRANLTSPVNGIDNPGFTKPELIINVILAWKALVESR